MPMPRSCLCHAPGVASSTFRANDVAAAFSRAQGFVWVEDGLSWALAPSIRDRSRKGLGEYNYLEDRGFDNRSPLSGRLVVSCDVYRPAAIDQLHALAEQAGVEAVPRSSSEDPVAIALAALAEARRRAADVLLVDTAGRLHIDADMMDEIKRIHAALSPIETLFVVDSMTGQDAATTSKAFDEALPLTGIVLTKIDGDARGGGALSVRQITGKPIKFIGSGEKTDAIEPFHPDRIASRILGMGDVLSLIEEAEQKVDREKAEKFADKITRGKRFDLQDFAEQLGQMRNMGGVSSVLEKMPGMPAGLEDRVDNQQFARMEAIIFSMTSQERRYPAVIKGSRKRRIAAGSGTRVQDVNQLLKQFEKMQKMMKKMNRKGGMGRMLQNLPGMKNFRGGLPPGLG
eukprot:XP_019860758.1 PREDICTED: uncharacterized protein LOC100637734 [Amphimedon queenslandica]